MGPPVVSSRNTDWSEKVPFGQQGFQNVGPVVVRKSLVVKGVPREVCCDAGGPRRPALREASQCPLGTGRRVTALASGKVRPVPALLMCAAEDVAYARPLSPGARLGTALCAKNGGLAWMWG
ncbi:Scm-Like With Four Mbt Domains Protein 2 [Manis pentadactyla]|nr:Scm-Like With Four Mbt Domains Protein 2 [Manis pentadactyla]